MATKIWPDNDRLTQEFLLDPEHNPIPRLRAVVGGDVELVTFRDGSAFVVREDAIPLGLEVNDRASALSQVKGRPLLLRGVVVFLSATEARELAGAGGHEPVEGR